jgi:cation diffusion facilitator CzcD-associated flavoprotein CzcO
MTSSTTDIAIVGAGPYGLSLAAHLTAAGAGLRIFGRPMQFWREHMPTGMRLKSPGLASNLSDPARTDTLEMFCRSGQAEYLTPVPLDTFVEYGEWFQGRHAPEVEQVDVTDIAPVDGGYELTLATGERVQARSVVVAVGVQHFARVAEPLSELPADRVSHSSAHRDLSVFGGRDVVVVGAGQSALEAAALLHEHGAQVRVIARRRHLMWNGDPLPPDRPLARRLREPENALGSGWRTWFYANRPALYRRLPAAERVRLGRTALGPAGAWWLRSRIEGQVPVLLGHRLITAQPVDGGVRLGARTTRGSAAEIVTEHVIAGTGYRVDLARLPFIGPSLRGRIRTVSGGPNVDANFESSLPGLYFIGPAVVSTFGPAMRFVWGAGFPARVLAQHLRRGPSLGRRIIWTSRTPAGPADPRDLEPAQGGGA